jgi:hypothetical protein
MRRCAYEPCGKRFQPSWANHIYHTTKCRRAAFELNRAKFIRKARELMQASGA